MMGDVRRQAVSSSTTHRDLMAFGRQFFFSSSASITMMPLGPRTYVSL